MASNWGSRRQPRQEGAGQKELHGRDRRGRLRGGRDDSRPPARSSFLSPPSRDDAGQIVEADRHGSRGHRREPRIMKNVAQGIAARFRRRHHRHAVRAPHLVETSARPFSWRVDLARAVRSRRRQAVGGHDRRARPLGPSSSRGRQALRRELGHADVDPPHPRTGPETVTSAPRRIERSGVPRQPAGELAFSPTNSNCLWPRYDGGSTSSKRSTRSLMRPIRIF